MISDPKNSIYPHCVDGSPDDTGNRAAHVCEPDEVVPSALRARLRWDWRHDAAAADVMREYGLQPAEGS